MTIGSKVALLSQWIDASYPEDMDLELVLRRRVGKIMNEVGEVAQALEGFTGENPRKGKFASADDVMEELLDVAVTALGAWEHMAGNLGNCDLALSDKLDKIIHRAGLWGAE